MILYIKVGSITNAQRGQKILRQNGYKASIKKTDEPVMSDGCGYTLVLRASDRTPVRLLSKAGISVRGVDEG